MTNRPRQKKHQAFLDDIRTVEEKHGLRLGVVQPPPQMTIEEFKPNEEQVAD